jgi:hypothetical protein
MVMDPHFVNADTDSAFHLNSDPDPAQLCSRFVTFWYEHGSADPYL